MLKLTGLRHFVAACGTRNFTTAAEMLGVSQPALTQAIAKLERQLDVELFDRTSRPLGLTPYGEVLLDHANRLEQGAEDLASKLAEIKAGTGGQIRVGCGPDWIHELVPDAIASLQSERTGLRISLTVGLNDELMRRLDAGDIDLFFASMSDSNFGTLYETRVMLREPMLVIARVGHPGIPDRPMTLKDLAALPWVLTGQDTFGRQLLKRLFGRSGVAAPTPVIETNSVRAMINILRKSDNLGFLSRTHTEAYPDIQAVETTLEMPFREGGAVWRRDTPLTPAAHALIERIGSLVAAGDVPVD